MNERIRELSDIAYKNHLKNNPQSSFGRRSDYDREFAELIVRECAALIPAEQSHAPDGRPMAKIFEEHFGVEL